jgi:GPH family glycoside/pentoside/hexuronide:cation symporter
MEASNSANLEEKSWGSKTRLAFSIGEIGDGTAYQSFTFLIFPFYFTVAKLPVLWISTGFIIWSIWNSLNDPLIGILSDKTKSKYGRRIIWMMGATIPLAIMMVLLFTPPLSGTNELKFMYFLFALFIFDTIYTAFNLNYNALWSEMFTTVKDRSEVGRLRGIFVIVSLAFAYIMPTLVIEDMTNQYEYAQTPSQFITVGAISAIVILISYFIVLKWGARQTKEHANDAESTPSFKDSILFTFKNKSFQPFVFAALATWICNGILPTIVPLFATYILGIADENSILIGVILLAGFLTGGLTMPMWTKIRQLKGARYTGLIVFAVWAIALMIFMNTYDLTTGIIGMILVGFGLGGSIYFYDQCIAEIIDEDEIKYGTRRAGAYYGIVSLIIRLSGVINFLMIGVIFSGTEWSTYTPNPGVDTIAGIRFLIGWFPVIVLIVGFIALLIYPIKGERLANIQKGIEELHKQKLAKMN